MQANAKRVRKLALNLNLGTQVLYGHSATTPRNFHAESFCAAAISVPFLVANTLNDTESIALTSPYPSVCSSPAYFQIWDLRTLYNLNEIGPNSCIDPGFDA